MEQRTTRDPARAGRRRPRPALRGTEERNALVLQHRYLPRYVAGRLAHHPAVRRLGPEEAESLGYLALLRAAELYDPARGATFCTYAYQCVARALTRGGRVDSLIRVPPPGRRR